MSKEPEPEIPHELAALTPRRRSFVVAYCGEHIGNAAASYRAAGFGAETEAAVYAGGSRLLADQSVQAAVEALMGAAPGLATVPEVAGFLTRTMRDNSLPVRDRLKAAQTLARSLGMFQRRQEVTGKGGGPIAVATVPAFVEDPEDFAKLVEQERELARIKREARDSP